MASTAAAVVRVRPSSISSLSPPSLSSKINRARQQASTPSSLSNSEKRGFNYSILCPKESYSSITPLYATSNGPRGFGHSPETSKKTKKSKTSKKNKKSKTRNEKEKIDDDDDDDDDEPYEGIIPEVVTNRMISRMGFSVGIPLFVGLMFFPFFYYLKIGLKIDVPNWVPFIVSFFFFGSALMGVSYGIVSSSWDPLREGSLLGWNEAQKNWPVFWQSIRGRSGEK